VLANNSLQSTVVDARLMTRKNMTMDNFERFIPIVGMVLLLFAVPVLTLLTLVVAAINEKISGFLQSFGIFVGYLLWLGVGMALVCLLPLGQTSWWLPVLIFWLLPGSLPHGLIWLKGMRARNRRMAWVGTLGGVATVTATVGIGLLCYSARFY